LAWHSSGHGLILNTTELSGRLEQITYLSYPHGEARRITNDTNDYDGVSLTADFRTLATVQEKSSFDAWVAPFAELDSAKPITSGGSSGQETWTPSKRLCSRNAADREKRRFDIPRAIRWAPDSRSVLYIKNEGGVSNLWRQPISGEPPKQISHFNSLLIRSFDLSPDSNSSWIAETRTGTWC
jgi:hypothetical protein